VATDNTRSTSKPRIQRNKLSKFPGKCQVAPNPDNILRTTAIRLWAIIEPIHKSEVTFERSKHEAGYNAAAVIIAGLVRTVVGHGG
jgi:hypothetical protein